MYRTIDVKMWTDPQFKLLDPTGKLVFVYLITNPHAHVSGIYYLPKSLASHETGVDEALLDTVYDTLSGAGFACFDTLNEVVWVKNMFRHQSRGPKAKAAAVTQLTNLHNSSLCHAFCDYYPEVADGVDLPPLDTVSIGYSAENDIGTGTGTGTVTETSLPSTTSNADETSGNGKPKRIKHEYHPHFNIFQLAYPRSVKKGESYKAWLKAGKSLVDNRGMTKPEAVAFILEAAKAFAASPAGQLGKMTPYPSTWLNGKQYDDDRTEWEDTDGQTGTNAERKMGINPASRIRKTDWSKVDFSNPPASSEATPPTDEP